MTHSLILNIDIDKEARGNYVARAHQGNVLVTEPELYDSISTAIRQEALAIPPSFAHFVEFTYNGMSTGTYAVEDVPGKAAELADRLVALNHQMHILLEDRRSAGA
ncbi:hypothetical protein PMI15_04055 [Polaromonas sp. CF318]|uniref:hypothetical protein n=1 Tax=Polaromonas sp. CF318 TaxID=1144318 RepID=UPI0002713D70|nr:hypothetical protein [Polaromonas sp. CF318]EJL79067.1 hypothetical protein PMI15_04055 [Polaromonas sp. CF318]